MVAQAILLARVDWSLLANAAIWLLVVVAALVALAAVAWYFRRRSVSAETGVRLGPGFTIDELEEMHAAGRISEEEFRLLRRAALPLEDGERKKAGSPVTGDGADADENQAEGTESPPKKES